MSKSALDATKIEILNRKFAAIADEMALTLKRTSRSPFVKDSADFGCGIADVKGYIFGWPTDSTVSGVSSIYYPIFNVINSVPDLEPGDIIGTNDPFASGGLTTHLSDYHLVAPYFVDGKIVGYGWCFCHFSDVGGRVPGSVSVTNTSIFDEGLRVPPIKVVKRGVLNEDFITIFKANSRTPDVNVGDFKALVASLATGRQRFDRLVARHGAEAVLQGQEQVQAYAEAKTRAVLRKIPDGSYDFWDYLDDDGVSAVPVRIRVKATFRDGTVEIDLTGTDPAVASALNYTSGSQLRSGFTRRLVTFVCTHDKTIPFNSGIFRAFGAVVPAGSVLSAEYPDAISSRVDTTRRLNDVMNGILLQGAPDHMAAPAGGASITLVLAEPDVSGDRPAVNVIQALRGGMGAYKGNDGVDGRDVSYINMKNQRLETVENVASVRVEEYDIRTDSGGPGKWRGGVGQSLTMRLLRDDCTVIIQGADRLRFPGWGVFGGMPAAPYECHVNLGTPQARKLGKSDQITLSKGETITLLMPGGSGYGDPLERAPDLVASDLRFGFVSVEGARNDYGVALREGSFDVDVEATQALRDARRRNRETQTFSFGGDREVWETIFTDELMSELNRKLYAMPKAQRQPARRKLFEYVLPGLNRSGSASLAEAVGDPGAASARLREALAEFDSAS